MFYYTTDSTSFLKSDDIGTALDRLLSLLILLALLCLRAKECMSVVAFLEPTYDGHFEVGPIVWAIKDDC